MMILSGKQQNIKKFIILEGQIIKVCPLEVSVGWQWLLVSHWERPMKNYADSGINFALGHLRKEWVVHK